MTKALDDAISRVERIEREVAELLGSLRDRKAEIADGQGRPPRPRAPATEPVQPGQPAPTTYGARQDQAATADMKRTLRAMAKTMTPPLQEANLDAMAQRKFGKSHWNMVSQREYMILLKAVEAGER